MYSYIEFCFQIMTHINEDKRKTENQIHIFDIFNDIENCPAHLVSSHRRYFFLFFQHRCFLLNDSTLKPWNFFSFVTKVDVVELGGGHEICGKGYELTLFLFNDVLEVSKKKSLNKGLGLRSPSTMSLRSAGLAMNHTPHGGGGSSAASNTSRPHKHVDLMNLSAIKRVVNISDIDECENMFALVCRSNQVSCSLNF